MSNTGMSNTGMSSTGMSSTGMSSTGMSSARERFSTRGADDPDQLIGVAAAELLEWGWLVSALADWLAQAPNTTTAEFTRHFAGHPTREGAAWMLEHIAERIAALLDGDRGQP